MTDRNPMIIPPKTRISATKYSQNLFVYVFHELTLKFQAHAVLCDDEI